ncbi:mitogen-activated protein kinase kinase kinase 14 [Salarias fasciatus]|uniref:mitogen-activated protein kinase kinase kinase 14 n=1 Tax=Salarias fasciatus TaxID=181472 RepID=UPI001176CC7B|nr:mitogen-activated protein kinase kinase kinase 14-like [Salarias fasciatus]
MAIPRVLNSNTPLIIVTGESEPSFLSKHEVHPGGEAEEEEEEEEEEVSLVQAIGPHLSRVMQQGTATHVAESQTSPHQDPAVSIVAQAESEDFQEFSPSNTQCPFPRSQLFLKRRSLGKEVFFLSDTEDEDFDDSPVLPHYHLQRKQRRKAGRRPEDGEQRPIIRGLWVQEVDWLKSSDRDSAWSVDIIPPPPQFTDSNPMEECGGVGGSEDDTPSSSEDSDRSLDSVHTHESESDSSCTTPLSTLELMHVSSSHPDLDSDSSGCEQGMLGDPDHAHSAEDTWRPAAVSKATALKTAVEELRGKVTQIPKTLVSAGFGGLIRRILNGWKTTNPTNEGLLFHHRLQPSGGAYREGEHYSVLQHIQNGSYGDVFCVRDKRSGFKCAAKRIPLGAFSGEEVSTWSGLDSPGVVELFGAVREGPNVVLFMDLKPGCLGQLLKEMSCLPEDLALHYLHQTLGALQHLHHRKVLHLDVKADNVLLSADCRDSFLCDFGLAQTLDDGGQSSKAFRGPGFPGTETHMAPEVARGDRLSAKADVWSSCCMLLHMLNGHQPWTRLYCHPLCLQIVNEPPPLWEVPSNCNNFTAKVFRAGLQKDPLRRATAWELQRKTTKALRAVGGLSLWSLKAACETLRRVQTQTEDAPRSLTPVDLNEVSPTASAPAMYWVSPWRTTAVDEDSDRDQDTDDLTAEWDSEPKSLRDDYTTEDWLSGSESEVDIYMGEEEWLKTDRDYEEDEDEVDGEDWDSLESTEYLRALRGHFPLLHKGQLMKEASWGSEEELELLRDDVALGTTMQSPSPEPRDDPPSCFSCSETSQLDASETDSDRSSDDLSSGVFSSCNSQTDARVEWTASTNQPSSYCFEGVDIWIENVQGECLRIRERRRVKVGHVAIGISDQISGKAFTLETLDRKTVPFEQEIKQSGLWLRCVPAPDRCQRWRWRVQDGKLELRE